MISTVSVAIRYDVDTSSFRLFETYLALVAGIMRLCLAKGILFHEEGRGNATVLIQPARTPQCVARTVDEEGGE